MDAIEALQTRRSCRSFTTEPLKDEDLNTILACGLNAPSGSNKQDARIIIVRDPNKVKALSKLNAEVGSMKSDPFYGATTVCLIVAPKDCGYKEDAYQLNPVKNGSLVIGAMQTAAYAIGVGSCWINRCKETLETAQGQAILRELGMAEYQGVGCCILGYPAKMPGTKLIKENRVVFY